MAHSEFLVESSFGAAEAFDLLIDLTRVQEWDRGIHGSRQLSGDGHVVGSTYDVTVTGFDGKPAHVVYELLTVDRPADDGSGRFVMEGVNDVLRAHDTIDVEPNGAGCTVRYSARLDLLGSRPPLTDTELGSVFVRIAGIAETGLRAHLNP